LLSIVILTHNSISFIDACLASVFSQRNKALEVIVVDNASCDGTTDLVKERYPRAMLIENRNNIGAAAARNQGIALSRGEWVCMLDCDTVLGEGFINRALCSIGSFSDRVGMIQPKILDSRGRKIYSCGIRLSSLRRFYDIGRGEHDNGQYDRAGHVFGACSAAALYKREMLEDIKEESGYFDERFFFLAEDVDLAWRARNKGWSCQFLNQLICCHRGNSSETGKRERRYLCLRNRYYLIIKNDTRTGFYKALFFFPLYDLPRLLFLLPIPDTIKAALEISAFCRLRRDEKAHV